MSIVESHNKIRYIVVFLGVERIGYGEAEILVLYIGEDLIHILKPFKEN